MIDRHTATLTRDNREHAVALLDALALERAVDDAWTSKRRRANALSNSDSKPDRRRAHRRVDARWTPRLVLAAPPDNGKELISRNFLKPSNGLEPLTPSSPCAPKRLPWVAARCQSACLSRFRGSPICHRLRPLGSIPSASARAGGGSPLYREPVDDTERERKAD
jgi:hypothetical protein